MKKYNFKSGISNDFCVTTIKKMDQVNSDASAPDSWDSLDDPGPVEISGEAKNVDEQLQSLNINAKPFVPNVNAPAFVPSFLRSQATEGVRSLFSYLFAFVVTTFIERYCVISTRYDINMNVKAVST